MTLFRLISPASRAGLLVLAGTALIAAPLLLQLGTAPMVSGILVGILAIGLALAGTDNEGRGTLPLSAQAVYDRGLGFGLLLSAGIFGLAGETQAMVLFAATGLVALIVTSVTRYSARPI